MYRLCLDLRILRLCLDFSPPLGLMYDMFCFQTAIRCGVSHVSIGFGFLNAVSVSDRVGGCFNSRLQLFRLKRRNEVGLLQSLFVAFFAHRILLSMPMNRAARADVRRVLWTGAFCTFPRRPPPRLPPATDLALDGLVREIMGDAAASAAGAAPVPNPVPSQPVRKVPKIIKKLSLFRRLNDMEAAFRMKFNNMQFRMRKVHKDVKRNRETTRSETRFCVMGIRQSLTEIRELRRVLRGLEQDIMEIMVVVHTVKSRLDDIHPRGTTGAHSTTPLSARE